MGIKERRTKILLSLFLLSDVNFKTVHLGKQVEIGFDLSFNQKTRSTLAALLKDNLIEKSSFSPAPSQENQNAENPSENVVLTTQNEEYNLTYKGFQELCLDFPFFRFLKDDWDGKWRIMSYEIPEKKRELRDKLRREVAGWGLGPWHRSFWVTPHPIIDNLKDLISQKEEEQYVQAFEAAHVFGNQDILIEKVWQKSSLDKQYRELFKKWHDILSSNIEGAKEEDQKLEKFKLVISEYITLLRVDPGLPAALIGSNWIGFEAYNIFKEIRSILLG